MTDAPSESRPAPPARASRPLVPEIMDGELSHAEARRALVDLDRVNRWLLGRGSLVRTLAPRLATARRNEEPSGRPVLLLDLGTGSGRTTWCLTRARGVRGAAVRVVGVDRRLAHLVVGRSLTIPQLRVVASAEALPFRDGVFDWSCSTLFFHHFAGRENRRILGEMLRTARRGAAVVDLRRSRLAVGLARLVFPVLRIGRVARHDGYLSIAQSWTVDEVRELACGLPVVELRRRFPFRWSLVLAP